MIVGDQSSVDGRLCQISRRVHQSWVCSTAVSSPCDYCIGTRLLNHVLRSTSENGLFLFPSM